MHVFKKISLFLCLFSTVYSQGKDVQDSLVLNFIKNSSVHLLTNTPVNYKIDFGYGGGVVFYKNKNKHWVRNLSLEYVYSKIPLEKMTIDRHTTIQVTESTLSNLSLSYFYDYNIISKKNSVFIFSGFYFNLFNRLAIKGTQSTSYPNSYRIVENSNYNQVKRSKEDVGLLFGLGISTKLKDINGIALRASYNHGFLDITSSDYNYTTNRYFKLSIGYFF